MIMIHPTETDNKQATTEVGRKCLLHLKAAHGYRPSISAWHLMYPWTPEISPLTLLKLSRYLEAEKIGKKMSSVMSGYGSHNNTCKMMQQ